jgi:hypothetical protein
MKPADTHGRGRVIDYGAASFDFGHRWPSDKMSIYRIFPKPGRFGPLKIHLFGAGRICW